MPIELSAKGLKITPRLKSWLDNNGYRPRTLGHSSYVLKAAEAMSEGDLSAEDYLELTNQKVSDMTQSPSPEDVFSSPKKDTGRIRVKAPSERLSEKRYIGKHCKTKQPIVTAYGQEASTPSEKSLAQTGVYLKQSARRAGIDVEISEFEKALWSEMIEQEQWASFNGDPGQNVVYEKGRVKALLDDAPSGGLEIAPISFDSDIVSNVLLSGELFPFIDRKPVSRGRRIEGASVGHPTIVWGTAEGTEGTLQDFSSYVSAIDTTIYAGTCFCEVGRDFLSDSPVNVGQVLTDRISEAYLKEMDDIIADGNGTTQPEGVMQKSGTTSVTFGSAMSIGNMESLLFAVAKQYRKAPGNTFMFAGNETSYQRFRAIPVGASDARRIFGLDHEAYQCFPPRRFAINEDLGNTELFAGDMKRYRMYERLGLSTQWSTEGKSLLRSNTALLAVRFRYGGQVMTPEAFATVSDNVA